MKGALIFLRRFPAAAAGLALVLLALAAAVAAPFYADAGLNPAIAQRLTPPAWHEGGSPRHWLGTDELGRDVLVRIGLGIGVSLQVGLAAVGVSMACGLAIGLLAGYIGGWLDDVLMRLADILLAIPVVLLAISVMGVLKPGIRTLILVIAFTQWMHYARAVRGEVLSLRTREFVESARAAGASSVHIIRRHLLPNVLPTVIALATLNISLVILIEAGLSFLGLGVQPPTPSLGGMLEEARSLLIRAPWLATYPGLALMGLVLGINLVGDGLRAYLDPHG